MVSVESGCNQISSAMADRARKVEPVDTPRYQEVMARMKWVMPVCVAALCAAQFAGRSNGEALAGSVRIGGMD